MRKIRSPRLRQIRRRQVIIRSIIIAVVLVVAIVLPTYLSHLAFWNINKVEVSGVDGSQKDEVSSLSWSALNGKYFFLVPKTNALFYPKKKIAKSISENHPEILDVTVSLKDLKTLSIDVKVRQPSTLICDTEENCFFQDQDGFVYSQAAGFTDNVYIKFEKGQDDIVVGQNYFSKDVYQAVLDFVTGLKQFAFDVTTIKYLENGEFSVTLATGESIIFTTRDPITTTLSNLNSVLADQSLGLREGKGLSVSYIDLRYGNKIYFKKKGE